MRKICLVKVLRARFTCNHIAYNHALTLLQKLWCFLPHFHFLYHLTELSCQAINMKWCLILIGVKNSRNFDTWHLNSILFLSLPSQKLIVTMNTRFICDFSHFLVHGKIVMLNISADMMYLQDTCAIVRARAPLNLSVDTTVTTSS